MQTIIEKLCKIKDAAIRNDEKFVIDNINFLIEYCKKKKLVDDIKADSIPESADWLPEETGKHIVFNINEININNFEGSRSFDVDFEKREEE